MIEEYYFGSITINRRTYNHDVEVRWEGEVLKWWKRESHLVNIEDVQRAMDQNPDTIVIGTGEMGAAKVTENCQNFITQKGIKLIIDKTEEAVKTFNIIRSAAENEEGRQNWVIGLFHLTC